jgi:AraC-like DNA-binding protein
MGSFPRPLFVLHADTIFQEQLQKAVRTDFVIYSVECWNSLRLALEKTERRALVVVDPYSGTDGTRLALEFRSLLDSFPHVPSLAVLEVAFERYTDIRLLLEWGVVEIIGEGHHDVGGISALLRAARRRPAEALLQRVVPSWLPARAMPLLVAIAEVADEGGKVPQVAAALHISVRSLLRWCEAARLPPPRLLLTWFRVLRAAEMLDCGETEMKQVVTRCGFASESGLRQVTRDLLKLEPTGLRAAGARQTTTAAFHAMLAGRAREPADQSCRRIPNVLRPR